MAIIQSSTLNRCPSPVYPPFTSCSMIIRPSVLCVHTFSSSRYTARQPAHGPRLSHQCCLAPCQGPMSSCELFYYHTLLVLCRLLPPPSTVMSLENLESLSLCFSDPISIYYFTYSFAELHFPHLRTVVAAHPVLGCT